ncbi:TetR/AcrR family transcriptional regulator [Aeromicrobium sp. Sec7.5]|uniref:TetR/AcrR family transcriptional regulator n=1 Tax=Aeromicrobium sp. Sec7.5 TaxID=3121276 RepID=UPI002FE4DCB1
MVRTQPDDEESKSARTRRRILDAAAEVLATRGYASTRLGEVAEKAEVQAPAIYYYFASREDLVEEVLHSGTAGMREHLEAALDTLPDDTAPLERLSVAVVAHLRHLLDPSSYAAATVRNAAHVPDAVRHRLMASHGAHDDIWARLLQTAQAAGEIRGDLDLHHARLLVTGALNQTLEWRDDRRGDLESLAATASAFVLRGLT